MKFKQILNLGTASNGQTTQSSVDFSHVRDKPLSVEFVLSGPVELGDLTVLAKFLNPSPDGFQGNTCQFFLVQWIVEFPVEAPTVAHQAIQFASVGGHRGLVCVIR